MAKDWHFIPLYAVALQEARASGDVEAMETVARRADSEGAGDAEIQKAAAELRVEIERLRGGGGGRNEPRPLYAEAMQQARASGDAQQMRELIQRAEAEGAGDPAIQAAAADLRAALGQNS
jgi:hypothetical protein